jgi:hypothetical protein
MRGVTGAFNVISPRLSLSRNDYWGLGAPGPKQVCADLKNALVAMLELRRA